jgi:hypothetical protein
VVLGLAHALAEIRDGAPSKSPQLRRLCLRLAILRLSDFEFRQPETQLGAVLGRKLRDGLLGVFQGHPERLAFCARSLNTGEIGV